MSENAVQRVVMAGDHSSLELRARLKKHLEDRGYEVNDLGTQSSDSTSYALFAEKACAEYLLAASIPAKSYAFGILVCGTGIGISISANKIDGIRCALPQNCYAAEMARRHNNANFIAFGARISYAEAPEDIIDAYVGTEFEGGRHAERIAQMMSLEKRKVL